MNLVEKCVNALPNLVPNSSHRKDKDICLLSGRRCGEAGVPCFKAQAETLPESRKRNKKLV